MRKETPDTPKPGDPPRLARLPLVEHIGWTFTVATLLVATAVIFGIALLQPRLAPELPPTVLWAIPAFFSMIVVIQLYRTLLHERKLARTDALTYLGNRRFFDLVATAELNRSRRYNRPFALAYMDVDHFKAVNDRYGHLAGDRLLQLIARTAMHGLRRSDVVARIGGDEFAMLLPETPTEGAQVALEKIHERLAEAVAQAGYDVAFSTGVIVYDAGAATVAVLLDAADRVMYEVKKAGHGGILVREFSRAGTPR